MRAHTQGILLSRFLTLKKWMGMLHPRMFIAALSIIPENWKQMPSNETGKINNGFNYCLNNLVCRTLMMIGAVDDD